MKITKNGIKADTQIEDIVVDNTISDDNIEVIIDKYGDAKEHIQQAIEILATNYKDDVIARDSIANLSVILVDLQ